MGSRLGIYNWPLVYIAWGEKKMDFSPDIYNQPPVCTSK